MAATPSTPGAEMSDRGRWSVGDRIILREVYEGRVWAVRPVTVVADSSDRIALYHAPGTIWRRPVSASGEPLRLQAPEWDLADLPWTGNAALRLTTPGAAHSVILWWEPASWRFEGWYVNLEQPFRRTNLGFDYLDQVLDIVVAPDRSSWFWKDEDEFATAQEARRPHQGGGHRDPDGGRAGHRRDRGERTAVL